MINLIKSEDFIKCINALEKCLIGFGEITIENGNSIVNEVKVTTGLNGKALYSPIRFAAIAQEHGPEMNKILAIVGKTKILQNIKVIKNKYQI
jgi:nondiscriminating glutamyl-tRNA synthetase